MDTYEMEQQAVQQAVATIFSDLYKQAVYNAMTPEERATVFQKVDAHARTAGYQQ